MPTDIRIKDLGQQADYEDIWQKMRDITDQRDENTIDEIWLLEHNPVFTQGLAGKEEHIINPHSVPIVHTDRGGQVTYHGPGQLVIYPLIDIKRKKIHARKLVNTLEDSVVTYLKTNGICAYAKPDAPGIYIDEAKICSIGLRIRKHASYHGIAFNIDMDLTPFSYINPCGYQGMAITQLRDHIPTIDIATVKKQLLPVILEKFGYNSPKYI